MATYKKKPKAVDLKPKSITEEELKVVRQFVDMLNQLQMKVGGLEFQKKSLLEQLEATQKNLYANNDKLKEKYGDVSVNIQDGTIKPLPKNEKSN
jgi:FtsZ-binding cell division protein ZapB